MLLLFGSLVLNYQRRILLKESTMVMNVGNRITTLNEERFVRAIPNENLRNEIRAAHAAQDMKQEFDVKVESMVGVQHRSTFTAGALVQLTNQDWIKSITRGCSGIQLKV